MYRRDGYRVSTDNPMYELVPYIMDKRYDASNSITREIDMELLQSYIVKCRKRGIPMNHMSIIIAAYLRTASQNPYLNRFVMNSKIYARNHFVVSFVTLTPIKKASTVNKIYFNLDDDIFTVNEKITAAIENCQDKDTVTAVDKICNALVKLPGLLSFTVPLLKFIDKHFWLPFTICHASPFHTSLFVTNLASIRVGAIYHHLYEFGTTGVFVSMGQPSKKVIKNKDGEFEERKVMELGIVTDERIADGHYYGQCFREWMSYLKHPEILEEKAASIVKDPDIKAKNPKFIVK
ncbi:MAG: 2-oxo acid dehydrogenase subunit E2 [Firmicutes bacterium]|nr:2-oxo acid dehydrogenase subunit E2 [Bacillota bacterium]